MSGRFSLVVFSVFVLAPATPAAPAAFEAVANSCATRRRAPLGHHDDGRFTSLPGGCLC